MSGTAIKRSYREACVSAWMILAGFQDGGRDRLKSGLVVTLVPKVPIWKVFSFISLQWVQRDCRKIGGQAAVAICGYGSLAG